MATQALGASARRPAINCPTCRAELVNKGAYSRKADRRDVRTYRCVVCRVNFSDAPAAHGGRPRSISTVVVVFTEAQQAITMDE